MQTSVGRVEELAATKCDFLAKLVPAGRNDEVKFRKNMPIGSYIGYKLTPIELLCDILYSRNTSPLHFVAEFVNLTE